ncbi:MAG: hypothetical protein QM747_01235 [Nocardioides sp.]
MTGTSGTHWIAECYWPGVQEDELRELGRRVVRATSELAGPGGPASYLGSLRVTDDEVVLFLFQGPIGAVRETTDRAGLRAERILRCIPDLTPPPPPQITDPTADTPRP